MFSNVVSEILTILIQAFMITLAGWIVVFAWQDIGGVKNFKAILFGSGDLFFLQKRRRKSRQNKADRRIDAFK